MHEDTQYEWGFGGRHRNTDFCIKELCTFMRILLLFLVASGNEGFLLAMVDGKP